MQVAICILVLAIILYILAKCLIRMIDLIFFKKRLNNGFIIVNGMVLKNRIFMDLAKESKEQFIRYNNYQRKKNFLILLMDLLEIIEPNVIYEISTHQIIIKRIKRLEKAGVLKIVKDKKHLIPQPMILNKLAIKNKNKLFECQRFHTIQFTLLTDSQ